MNTLTIFKCLNTFKVLSCLVCAVFAFKLPSNFGSTGNDWMKLFGHYSLNSICRWSFNSICHCSLNSICHFLWICKFSSMVDVLVPSNISKLFCNLELGTVTWGNIFTPLFSDDVTERDSMNHPPWISNVPTIIITPLTLHSFHR